MSNLKQFGGIYTDPPWPQKKGNRRECRPGQGKNLDYKTMTLEEIESFHRAFLRENAAESHNIFMWAIDKFLPDTEAMMRALGYTLHARIIWDKCNGVAPAFTLRFSHEYLLWFYKKGKMLMPVKDMQGRHTTVIREPSTTHSRKPIAAYEMLEALFPQTWKVELFARARRRGWVSFGDELPERKERMGDDENETAPHIQKSALSI